MTWAQDFRQHIDQQHQAGQLTAQDRALMLGYADFCERRDTVLPAPGSTIDLLGYGTVRPVVVSVHDHDVWIHIGDLAEPAGVDMATVEQHWRDELADGDADQVVFTNPAGDQWSLPVLNFQGVMRLFLTYSPWSAELMAALGPVFRRALVETGLGDAITGEVAQVDDAGRLHLTGETVTLTEAITAAGPLPSAEVARHQAMRGPAVIPNDHRPGQR
jgi:hypothetical protein